MEKLGGILLCGGKSSRMGKDKALLEIKNKPMVSYPLKVLQQFCSGILISANDSRLNFFGYPIIRDEIKDIGPIGGIQACLKQSMYTQNLVLACDMPFITGELVSKMIAKAEKYDAVVPLVNHKAEPLYAIYKTSILPMINHCIDQQNYSLQKLLLKLNVYYLEVKQDEKIELCNFNTASEILTYEQLSGIQLS